jgi:hypothetical protein
VVKDKTQLFGGRFIGNFWVSLGQGRKVSTLQATQSLKFSVFRSLPELSLVMHAPIETTEARLVPAYTRSVRSHINRR